MALEGILKELEKSRVGGPIRDTERYYFTLFGKPTDESRWGLSVEGHHLSLNFVVDQGRVVSSTPTFFGDNPADVKADFGEVKKGTRVLAKEEDLAFQLIQSCSPEQRSKVLIDAKRQKISALLAKRNRRRIRRRESRPANCPSSNSPCCGN